MIMLPTAHVESTGDQQSSTTSHWHPRAAHGSRNHVVNIGPAEERALLVTLKNNEDSFFLAMPKVDLYDHTPRAMMTTADSVYKKNKWTKSDLKEIKSLVLEHKVWEVKPLP